MCDKTLTGIIGFGPVIYSKHLVGFRFGKLLANCRGLGQAACKLCRVQDGHSITWELSTQPTGRAHID